jgi:hypothetical protein
MTEMRVHLCSGFGTEISHLNKSLNLRRNFALTYCNIRINSLLVSKKEIKRPWEVWCLLTLCSHGMEYGKIWRQFFSVTLCAIQNYYYYSLLPSLYVVDKIVSIYDFLLNINLSAKLEVISNSYRHFSVFILSWRVKSGHIL